MYGGPLYGDLCIQRSPSTSQVGPHFNVTHLGYIDIFPQLNVWIVVEADHDIGEGAGVENNSVRNQTVAFLQC